MEPGSLEAYLVDECLALRMSARDRARAADRHTSRSSIPAADTTGDG